MFHYNSTKLMDVLLRQVDEGHTGGIACEPNSIFVLCNNHPRIANVLHDAMHQSNYSASNAKWAHWLKRHGRAPDVLPDGDYRYFRIIYYEPAHAWIPIYGTSGNDAWALAFMNPWMRDFQFTAAGYEQMLRTKQWRKVAADQEYLDAGLFGRISELNSWLASSLFISVDNQFSSAGKSDKSVHVMNWFEKNFGSFYPNTTGCSNAYSYKINDTLYQIWTNAAILLGMVTDRTTFNEMYTRPFYARFGPDEPELKGVDYPRLHVKYAFFNRVSRLVEFGLKTDCFSDVSNTSLHLVRVTSFRRALLTVGIDTLDVTRLGHFDREKRTLEFTNLTVKHDGLNAFVIFI